MAYAVFRRSHFRMFGRFYRERRRSFVNLLAGAALVGSCAEVAAAAGPSPEYFIRGIVVRVADGDTLTIRGEASGNRYEIRLSDIDAPETGKPARGKQAAKSGQPYAEDAKRLLISIALNRQAEAACFEADRYGRHVCHLTIDGAYVHTQLLAAGAAWSGEKPTWRRDPRSAEIEAEARLARKGLWARRNPVPPWRWRQTCWSAAQDCPAEHE